jgi:hypothetical protein
VQQALIGGDLGVDADPKAHILFERRRLNEWIGRIGVRGKAVEERREQKPEGRGID